MEEKELSVDEKVEKLKSIVKKNTIKEIKFDNTILGLAKIQEHKVKKAKERRRKEIQRASRKANRKRK